MDDLDWALYYINHTTDFEYYYFGFDNERIKYLLTLRHGVLIPCAGDNLINLIEHHSGIHSLWLSSIGIKKYQEAIKEDADRDKIILIEYLFNTDKPNFPYEKFIFYSYFEQIGGHTRIKDLCENYEQLFQFCPFRQDNKLNNLFAKRLRICQKYHRCGN